MLNKHDVQPDFDTTATVPVCDEYILRPKRRSSSLPDRRGIAGEAHELPLTDGHTAVVFVREGKALVGADGEAAPCLVRISARCDHKTRLRAPAGACFGRWTRGLPRVLSSTAQ